MGGIDAFKSKFSRANLAQDERGAFIDAETIQLFLGWEAAFDTVSPVIESLRKSISALKAQELIGHFTRVYSTTPERKYIGMQFREASYATPPEGYEACYAIKKEGNHV